MAWTEKLLFWLTHDEESGTRYDSHWGHHFAEINTVMAAPGVNGNASLLVRGNNEYLRRTQGIAGFDPLQPWTYITRFYVNTEYRNAGFFGLLTPDGSNHALSISLNPERTQEISLFIRNTDGNNLWQGRTGIIDALTFGEWHTLRVEFDGGPVPPTNEGKTKGRIYIDNVPYIIDGEPLGTSGYIQTPAGGDFIGSGQAVIGYGPSHVRYFDGLFDDSALFQRLLTEDEIAEYEGGITYSQLSKRSILVPLSSAYDLTEFADPGYTGDAIDLHGSRNLTNVNGATGFSESGVIGASVRRASSQAFTTTDLADFIINSDEDFTIEIRFRRASTGTSTGVAGIHNIEDGKADRDLSALVLFIDANGNVMVRRGVNGSTYSTFSPGAVIADTADFHHLIYRWRRVGTTNSAFDETLFLDGQVFHRTYSWIPTSVPQASLWLGRTLADDGYGDLDIDFFRIYKEAITDYDAAYLWNNGSPRSYADLVGGGEPEPAEYDSYIIASGDLSKITGSTLVSATAPVGSVSTNGELGVISGAASSVATAPISDAAASGEFRAIQGSASITAQSYVAPPQYDSSVFASGSLSVVTGSAAVGATAPAADIAATGSLSPVEGSAFAHAFQSSAVTVGASAVLARIEGSAAAESAVPLSLAVASGKLRAITGLAGVAAKLPVSQAGVAGILSALEVQAAIVGVTPEAIAMAEVALSTLTGGAAVAASATETEIVPRPLALSMRVERLASLNMSVATVGRLHMRVERFG